MIDEAARRWPFRAVAALPHRPGNHNMVLRILIVVAAMTMSLSLYAAVPVVAPAAVIPPVLYQVVLNTTRRMALESLLRKVVVDLDTNSSWIMTLDSIADKFVGIFRVANASVDVNGDLLSYEIPLSPDKPVLDSPPDSDSLPEGFGTEDNPYPFSLFVFYVGSEGLNKTCRVDDDYAIDGVEHNVVDGDVLWNENLIGEDGLVRLAEECIFLQQSYCVDKGESCYVDFRYNIGNWPDLIVIDVGGESVFFEQKYLEVFGKYFSSDFGGFREELIGDYWEGSGFGFVDFPKEVKDDIKRFKRSGNGFLPDETDPDWTEEEIQQYGTYPKNIRLENNNEIITVVAGADGQRSYIEYLKKNPDGTVYQKTVYFDENVSPAEIVEEFKKDQTFDQAKNFYYLTYSSDPHLNPGVGTDQDVNIDISSLAKTGEAAAAANKVIDALEADAIDSVDRPGSEVVLPDFDQLEKDVMDLPTKDIGIDFSDFFPNIFPGDMAECHPIEFEGTISVGPARGLSSTAEFDPCWMFEIIRNILGWLFGSVTVIYVFRSFTRS
jgi:hypothetical protein